VLDPGPPATVADLSASYHVEVELADGTLYYWNAAGTPNVKDAGAADTVSRLTWAEDLVVRVAVPPVWNDSTLAGMRAGSAYSDGVTADSPTAVTYSISAGALPDGLSLNSGTGAITGTPECETEPCTYSFTIQAANAAGSITKEFTGTLLPAGVPPTWTDQDLPDELQVSVAVNEAVAAAGDPDISYSIPSGALPTGLSLDEATGVITGTPAEAGEFSFQITATNDHGTITADFDVIVKAAPDLGLRLNFAPDTRIEDATTLIEAEGLKVGSEYTLTMHSTPVRLHTGTIGASGGFNHVVSLPPDTPAGAHMLVLSGIAPDDSVLTARAWFVLLPNGRIGAISYSGPLSAGGLASTGTEPGMALGAATALLVLGAVAAARGRRKPEPGV